MLDLNSVMLGTHKPKELADYYEKVLGKEPDWTDGGWYGWRLGSGSLTVSEHLEVRGKATEPQRVMFNLETTEVEKAMQDVFWGDYFGSFTDRFGVQWMINHRKKQG